MSEPLVVSRIIQAEREQVFSAFVRPSELRKWWGPSGVECTFAEVEARLGGRYRIDNRLPDGKLVVIRGEFTEFQPPERLAYTWFLAASSDGAPEHVTIEFDLVDGGTRVTITHEKIGDEKTRTSHADGWVGCFEGLIEHLSGASDGFGSAQLSN